ncbi:MAG TPA: hypothetical protein PK752_01460 [Accumulibacter sp.]|uniref:hypothetical protein n=1 Tax=Accumulibacter sp. TaxID=2053492 RepID=UPI002BCDCAEA|nr:hypothetical protein [Accumulibacter sp.]HRD86914.1 hypothetical protein [Accumulibacter sp.]
MMNRPGYRRQWGDQVAHKGYFDRHGRHVLLPLELEEYLVRRCGGCYVALYQLPLRTLAKELIDWREVQRLKGRQ